MQTATPLQAIAEAFLEGDCFSTDVRTAIVAETGADFEIIEGCQRGDVAFGDASGSTDGSTAEGVRPPPPPPTCTPTCWRPCHPKGRQSNTSA